MQIIQTTFRLPTEMRKSYAPQNMLGNLDREISPNFNGSNAKPSILSRITAAMKLTSPKSISSFSQNSNKKFAL